MPYKLEALSTFNTSSNEILSYLIELSPNVASNYINNLEEQSAILAELPRLYPKYEHSDKLNIDLPLRKMVLTGYNYIVFYMVDDSNQLILLLDVIHASRDIKSVLAQKF